MELITTLQDIQQKLDVPKTRQSPSKEFRYRNTDDILNALNPILQEKECVVILSDEVEQHGNRWYIKATATLYKYDEKISASALAREQQYQTGLAEAQITGSASSYARKYALSGLFALDDVQDDDAKKVVDKKDENSVVEVNENDAINSLLHPNEDEVE